MAWFWEEKFLYELTSAMSDCFSPASQITLLDISKQANQNATPSKSTGITGGNCGATDDLLLPVSVRD